MRTSHSGTARCQKKRPCVPHSGAEPQRSHGLYVSYPTGVKRQEWAWVRTWERGAVPKPGTERGDTRGRRALGRWLLIALVVAALSSFVVPSAGAAGDLLVALTPNTSPADAFGSAGLLSAPRSLGQPGVYQIVVGDQNQALAALRLNPHVRYVERDGTVALTAPAELQQSSTTTQDHWGLDRVDAA